MRGRTYIALSIGFIAVLLLAAYAGLGEVWMALRSLNPMALVGIFALVVVCSLIAGVRLRAILNIYGHGMAYGDAYHINTLGMVGNALTPGVHVGGEVLRVAMLTKRGVHLSSAISSAIVIKVLDALVVLPLALLIALHSLETSTLPMLAAFSFAPYSLAAIAILRGGAMRRCIKGILSRVGVEEEPIEVNFSTAAGMGIAAMSYARWLTLGMQDYLIIRALGMDLSYAAALAVFTVSTLVRVAAPIPFGLGATEGATIGLYSRLGIAMGEATAVALLSRTYVTFVLLILGLCSGLRVGLGALRRTAGGQLKTGKKI